MESITGTIIDRILDPVLIVPAVMASAALSSGAVARVIERWQDRRP
jgi:hypothetical protein